MASTAKKKPRSRPARGSGRPKRSPHAAIASLAVVAFALAALLGGLLTTGTSPRSTVGSGGAVIPAQPSVEPVEAPSGAAQPSAQPSAETAPQPAAPTPAGTAPASARSGAGEREPPKAEQRREAPSQPASYQPAPRPLPPSKSKVLIFVIDDAGYSLKQLEAFLALPFPITISVLPGLPNSEKAAREVKAAGKELILHQPMQALGGQNPGPGAVLLGMDASEVKRIVEANLLTVPGALGMNNHMGSAATKDLGIMEAVEEVAKSRGIYYLDSLTTSGTAVARAAARVGNQYWERDVFLDNSPDRASIVRAVEDGKKRATKDRPAIMIGHVWSAELAQALTDLYPQLVAEGYSLSTISRFMVEEAEEEE